MKVETKFDVAQEVMFEGMPCVIAGIDFRRCHTGETRMYYRVTEKEDSQTLGPGSWCFASEEEVIAGNKFAQHYEEETL
jgi:hypothetical protein